MGDSVVIGIVENSNSRSLCRRSAAILRDGRKPCTPGRPSKASALLRTAVPLPGISQGYRIRMVHKRTTHNVRIFHMHSDAVNSRWISIAGNDGTQRICRNIHIKNTLL